MHAHQPIIWSVESAADFAVSATTTFRNNNISTQPWVLCIRLELASNEKFLHLKLREVPRTATRPDGARKGLAAAVDVGQWWAGLEREGARGCGARRGGLVAHTGAIVWSARLAVRGHVHSRDVCISSAIHWSNRVEYTGHQHFTLAFRLPATRLHAAFMALLWSRNLCKQPV